MAEKTIHYAGMRTQSGPHVAVRESLASGSGFTPLDPRRDLFNHSPAGFEWGYGGSGPAQLALAILAHHLRRVFLPSENLTGDDLDRLAVRLHQHFKFDVIGRLSGDSWEIGAGDVTRWLFGETAQTVIRAWDDERRELADLERKAREAELEAAEGDHA